ncbi:MAG: DIP1984 family protein [Clostridia bacterium]|nr:DIP1984 family protein [Clostridia bacterium]
MKLALALSERADLQRRIAELSGRLNNNAKTQEGEKSAEDPKELLAELDENLENLEQLIIKINLTNSKTVVDGVSLTEMIAKRDCLAKRLSVMRSFLDSASEKVDRYTQTEIKIVSTVSVSKLQKECDSYSKQLRQIDEKIQEANWTTELI